MHSIYGANGLISMNTLKKQYTAHNIELNRITKKLKNLKHRVYLLHPNRIDADFLEELLKERLGLIREDESVLIMQKHH